MADEETKVSKFTEKRNANKKVVKAFLDSNPEGIPANVIESIKYLAGMGARSEGMQVSHELRNLLLKGPVSSIDIFTKFEIGKQTMEKKIRDFIKAEPENRIWVAREGANYVVKGKGENAPRGWTGYIPVVKEDL